MNDAISHRLTPQLMARLLGVGFALPGVLGFLPNPLIGPNGLFAANLAHNLVHLVSAALFFYAATLPTAAVRRFTQVFGVVYLLVGVLGFVVLGGATEGMLLGLVHINQADNFLHIGLGALICIAGFRAAPVQAAAA